MRFGQSRSAMLRLFSCASRHTRTQLVWQESAVPKSRVGVSWRFSYLQNWCILKLLISKTAVSTSWPADMRESSHSAGRARDVLYDCSRCFIFRPHHAWRDLYLQALYETDKKKVCTRISEADG